MAEDAHDTRSVSERCIAPSVPRQPVGADLGQAEQIQEEQEQSFALTWTGLRTWVKSRPHVDLDWDELARVVEEVWNPTGPQVPH